MNKTIQHIMRLSNSSNGNPRFAITFTDGSAYITMSDAAFCYAVGNLDLREGCAVEIELTRSGRIRHMKAT